MITKKQKKVITEVLGKHYSIAIIFHLEKKKIYNTNGNTFSKASIQKIMNGTQPNEIVEMEIAKLVAKVKLQQQKDQETIKNLLK